MPARECGRRGATVASRDRTTGREPTRQGAVVQLRSRQHRFCVRAAAKNAHRTSPVDRRRRVRYPDQVVRHTGLDVSVDESDRHRAHGYLTRQGPPTLRWALFEAAMNASHHRSPDHAYYSAVKDRHDGKLAAISVARQFARRCYNVLHNLDPDVVYAMPD